MVRANVCNRFPVISRTSLRMRACEGGSSGGGLQNQTSMVLMGGKGPVDCL